MAKTVQKTVHVTDDNFQRHVFKKGETLPKWAEKLVTNPKVFESDEDEAPAAEVALEGSDDGDQGGNHAGRQGDGQGDPDAPKGNASREAWAEYATGRGVEVTGQMSRDDIRDAVAKADAAAAGDAQAQG